ncbi:MAG: hypothetical protein HY052_08260 [Proteobacteria bacterium]|nr:hypothetical protein [Pseudomonadota bacterium]
MGVSTNTLAARGLKPVAALAAGRGHGDRLRYKAGCRCVACRRANSAYVRARHIASKSGDWNGIIPAGKARAHIRTLVATGIDRRAISIVTGIADPYLYNIAGGHRKRIRARIERTILQVTKDQVMPEALISSESSWELIKKLVDKGYDKTRLAKFLGYQSVQLRMDDSHITIREACSIQRMYDGLKKCCFPGVGESANGGA